MLNVTSSRFNTELNLFGIYLSWKDHEPYFDITHTTNRWPSKTNKFWVPSFPIPPPKLKSEISHQFNKARYISGRIYFLNLNAEYYKVAGFYFAYLLCIFLIKRGLNMFIGPSKIKYVYGAECKNFRNHQDKITKNKNV